MATLFQGMVRRLRIKLWETKDKSTMSKCNPARQTVVILTISDWDEPKRLRKQLAEVLSRDMDVVYVTLPFGLHKPRSDSDRMDGNIRIISFAGPHIPFRFLHRFGAVRWVYERTLARRLNRFLKGAEVHSVFCFTQLHPSLLALFPREKVIYVANDDHASMAESEQAANRILADEARAIALSSRVLSVSEVIARRLSQFGRPVHVMYPGHGCDVLPLTRFGDDERLPRSVCFFGYIDWRVDFELLAHMLEAGWLVSLIGQEVSTGKQIQDLKSRFPGKFEVHPPMPSEIAPEMLARYQVLIMPYRYRNTAQAEVMELPNKTFVYLCAMRPVVTTWMPNLKLVEPGLIYRSKTNQEFIEACERAIQEDSEEYARRRSEIARQNSWDGRRVVLKNLVDGELEVFGGGAK